jgi:GMP synthase-like glutamine amidotransferase
MRVLVIRHHAEDSAGFIGAAFEERGADVESHLIPDDGPLPPPGDFDHVVVLGAKWSVYDRNAVGSWIDEELEFLRRADGEGVPVLGICFGSQALTAALGGRVEAAPTTEMGWMTIEAAASCPIGPGPWFQFHSDRCLPPVDAEILATSDVCVQAFALRRNLGVQFHPEVDADQLRGWYENGCRELVEEAGRDPGELLDQTKAEEPLARERARGIVEAALSVGVPLVAGASPRLASADD